MRFGLQHAIDARVIYVDMNAFYASIEQQEHPELRGKPVAVISHDSPRGTVLASSYEAKALGVTTGTKVRDALALCPGLTFADTDARLYKAFHLRLKYLLEDTFGPEVEMRSIDEAAISMTGNQIGSARCKELAATAKRRIKRELGEYIRSSIGIAPNVLLAKLATDLQKPDGQVEITVANTREILSKISLTNLPGIAEANARRLGVHGITTPLEFYNANAHELRAWFGIWGQYWWWNLHGFEAPFYHTTAKTLSHEHVLEKWFTVATNGWPAAAKMADRVIYRLRSSGYRCQSLTLSVSFAGIPRFTSERYFDVPIGGYQELQMAVKELYAYLPDYFPAPARKLCITLGGLVKAEGEQLDLFAAPGSENLSLALQRIRSRHGFEAIQPASSLSLKSDALKEQPGFGRIRDTKVY
jgi:DNA polymerase-4